MTVTFYAPEEIRPRGRWLATDDMTATEQGRRFLVWNERNRLARVAYDKTRAKEGLWPEDDREASSYRVRYSTASITTETVSIVDGVEVLTVEVSPG